MEIEKRQTEIIYKNMEILFNKNMGWDKRDNRTCILSHNVSTDERGLITKQEYKKNNNTEDLSDSYPEGSSVVATTKNFVYLSFGVLEQTKVYRFKDDGLEYVGEIGKISSVDGNDYYDVALTGDIDQTLWYIRKDGIITSKVLKYTDGLKNVYKHSIVYKDFEETMYMGVLDKDVNGEVSYLQIVLGTSVTGVYDAELKTAVEQFQTDNGINADGIVGPETRGELNRIETENSVDLFDPNGYVFFDGLDFYYFINGKIFRQRRVKDNTDPETPEIKLVFGDYGDIVIEKVVDYNGYLHIFYQDGDNTADIIWDKKDPDVFEKTIKIEDRVFLGAGIIENMLIMGSHENERTNEIENIGRFIVSSFTGSGYKDYTKVKTGKLKDNLWVISNVINNKLYVSVPTEDGYDNFRKEEPDTWNSKVYEISVSNGVSITSVFDAKDKYIHSIQGSKWDNWIFTHENGVAEGYTNTDKGLDFGKSEFISTFMENQLKNHNDIRLSVVVDKYIDDAPVIEAYYRTSTRDEWTKIEDITYDKLKLIVDDKGFENQEPNNVLKQQDIELYQSHDADGEVIDEFREISIRFVISGRANIIRAYLSSNKNASRLIKSTA